MTKIEEKGYIGDVVLSERPSNYSRDKVTLASGAGDLKIGTVLGKRTKSSAVLAAAGGNTGNGAGALAGTALGAKAEVGVYTLTCTAEAANGGTFQVVAPSGYRLPDLKVGTAYAGDHINLTISDGAEDFDLGDSFTVTVSGTGKYVPAEYGAVDGTGVGDAILLENADATDADVENVLVLARDALVSDPALTYDASADDDTKIAALKAGLAAKGIVFTQGA
ncbi:MAG: head decoration protein [Micavibrio sp.]